MSNATGKFRILMDYMIDMALFWQAEEGLTIPECLERIVHLFGEDKRVSVQALHKRMKTRKAKLRNETFLGRAFEVADGMSDEDLLNWMRSQLHLHLYVAVKNQDPAEIRRNSDTLLKVLRAKKDLLGAGEDDSDKAFKEFADKFEELAKANMKAVN